MQELVDQAVRGYLLFSAANCAPTLPRACLPGCMPLTTADQAPSSPAMPATPWERVYVQ